MGPLLVGIKAPGEVLQHLPGAVQLHRSPAGPRARSGLPAVCTRDENPGKSGEIGKNHGQIGNAADTVPSAPKPPPRYLTTPEAARELSVNERTLRHWVATGQIEPDFRTAGGHMRWDVERVRAELRAGLRDRRDADEE